VALGTMLFQKGTRFCRRQNDALQGKEDHENRKKLSGR
jgi:hypothetical protein